MCTLALAFCLKYGSCTPIEKSITNLSSFREMEVKNSTDWMEKSVKSMNITDRRVDRMKAVHKDRGQRKYVVLKCYIV